MYQIFSASHANGSSLAYSKNMEKDIKLTCIRHSVFRCIDLGTVGINQGYRRLMLGFTDMEQSHDQLS